MSKKFKFASILAVVLTALGKKELTKTDGKLSLSTDDEKVLLDKYGEKFLTQFKEELSRMEPDSIDDADVTENMVQLENIQSQLTAALKTNKELQETINVLSFSAEDDKPEVVNLGAGKAGKRVAFKPDMNFVHNKVLNAYFNGDTSMMYSTEDTIDTQELRTEFGRYVSGEKIEILRRLTGELTCTRLMTTVVTDKTEWRASQAVIDSVLQQFTPFWTPSKKVKFTPLTIKNFKQKVNVPIKPADILGEYIGYMYDEKLTPDQMPIVKYIVDQLVLPKLMEDLEEAMCNGDFVEFIPTENGQAAQVNAAMKSMDGFLTTIKDLKAANKQIGAWLLDGVTLTRANIVDQFDKIHEQVGKQYRRKALPIAADPDLIRLYNLAYQDKFPTTKNEDENKNRLQFTKFTFEEVDGMIGTGCFFITPKENWKHLMSQNPNEAKIYMQVQDYDVKVFIEFWKGTGFAMQEAIFAYIPPTVPAGSGSAGGGL